MLEFNLKQLEAFVAAAEQGSFTAAAQALYLTQSTVSAHIQTLERALNAPLFERDAKRRIYLTEAGKAVYPRAREILARCQALREAVRGEEQLSVAASTVPCRCLLPPLMTGFQRVRPDCRFSIRRSDSAGVHRLLELREVRVGFVGARLNEEICSYQPLLQDRLVLLTAGTERFQSAKAAGMSGRALLNEPLILREPGSGTRRQFERWLEQAGLALNLLRVAAEIDQPETLLQVVESGLGVTVGSRLAAAARLDAGRLLAFELEDAGLSRDLCLATLRDTEFSPLEQAFAGYAVDFFSRLQPSGGFAAN